MGTAGIIEISLNSQLKRKDSYSWKGQIGTPCCPVMTCSHLQGRIWLRRSHMSSLLAASHPFAPFEMLGATRYPFTPSVQPILAVLTATFSARKSHICSDRCLRKPLRLGDTESVLSGKFFPQTVQHLKAFYHHGPRCHPKAQVSRDMVSASQAAHTRPL